MSAPDKIRRDKVHPTLYIFTHQLAIRALRSTFCAHLT